MIGSLRDTEKTRRITEELGIWGWRLEARGWQNPFALLHFCIECFQIQRIIKRLIFSPPLLPSALNFFVRKLGSYEVTGQNPLIALNFALLRFCVNKNEGIK